MSSSVKALAALSARGRRKSARTQSMTSITSGGKPHTAVNCFFHQSGRRDFVHKSEGDFDDLLRFRAGKIRNRRKPAPLCAVRPIVKLFIVLPPGHSSHLPVSCRIPQPPRKTQARILISGSPAKTRSPNRRSGLQSPLSPGGYDRKAAFHDSGQSRGQKATNKHANQGRNIGQKRQNAN